MLTEVEVNSIVLVRGIETDYDAWTSLRHQHIPEPALDLRAATHETEGHHAWCKGGEYFGCDYPR